MSNFKWKGKSENLKRKPSKQEKKNPAWLLQMIWDDQSKKRLDEVGLQQVYMNVY